MPKIADRPYESKKLVGVASNPDVYAPLSIHGGALPWALIHNFEMGSMYSCLTLKQNPAILKPVLNIATII